MFTSIAQTTGIIHTVIDDPVKILRKVRPPEKDANFLPKTRRTQDRRAWILTHVLQIILHQPDVYVLSACDWLSFSLTENIYQRKWPSCYDLSIRVDIQRVYAYMHIILWNSLIARINYIQISILSKITGLYIISPGLKQVEIHIHVAVLHMHLSTFGMLTLIMKKNYWNAGDINMYKHKRELLVRKMHAL